GLSNVIAVIAGIYHSHALQEDGTVVTWGSYIGGANFPLTGINLMVSSTYASIGIVGIGPPEKTVLLANPNRQPASFTVAAKTRMGRVYRLEYKNALSDPQWTGLPLAVATGDNLVL